MPRHHLNHPRVQQVIRRLVDLFQFYGSVRSVHRVISERQSGIRAALYPNRLHSLLSGDPARAVNSATLESLEQALSGLDIPTTGGERDPIRTRILRSTDALSTGAAELDAGELRAIADDSGTPVAVVVSVLGASGLSEHNSEGPALMARSPISPDWSFQDRAVQLCVRAFGNGPNRRIGLVVPTGGGKTRIALRVILAMLHRSDRDDTVAIWVTHRKELHRHARRELQRLLNEGDHELPDDAVSLVERRIRFVMISDVEPNMREQEGKIELVVVDEGHHIAAPSYQQIVETQPLRVMCATATPIRADGLPIHIDEIAYTITYRELIERGVLVEPVFAEPIVHRWSDPQAAANLADYLLERSESDFRKTLVVVSRTEYTELLTETLLNHLDAWRDHPLGSDDIGFVHGRGSSSGVSPEDFLDEFRAQPRGILIATAQLIGEGFDDPGIDSIVVTYPSTSIGHLMQVAGRALRNAPGKEKAYVVQCRESELAYHIEQRWLYEDISDRLRPRLIDRHYRNACDLTRQVDQLLRERNVDPPVVERVLDGLKHVAFGDTCHLLLSGLPYYKSPDRFGENASWGVVLVTPDERAEFLRIFNDFSDQFGDVKDHSDYLRRYITPDMRRGSRWKGLMDMLSAMDTARREIARDPNAGTPHRNYEECQGTTWLTYVSFTLAPDLPAELDEFLADAVNRDEVTRQFLDAPDGWRRAVKLPLPLSGTLAFLLNADQTDWLMAERGRLAQQLNESDPAESFATVAGWRLGLGPVPIPAVVIDRFGDLVSERQFQVLSVTLRVVSVITGSPT